VDRHPPPVSDAHLKRSPPCESRCCFSTCVAEFVHVVYQDMSRSFGTSMDKRGIRPGLASPWLLRMLMVEPWRVLYMSLLTRSISLENCLRNPRLVVPSCAQRSSRSWTSSHLPLGLYVHSVGSRAVSRTGPNPLKLHASAVVRRRPKQLGRGDVQCTFATVNEQKILSFLDALRLGNTVATQSGSSRSSTLGGPWSLPTASHAALRITPL
jgi:hypothetical protein